MWWVLKNTCGRRKFIPEQGGMPALHSQDPVSLLETSPPYLDLGLSKRDSLVPSELLLGSSKREDERVLGSGRRGSDILLLFLSVPVISTMTIYCDTGRIPSGSRCASLQVFYAQ